MAKGQGYGENEFRMRPYFLFDTERLSSTPGSVTFFQQPQGAGIDPFTGLPGKSQRTTNLLDASSPAKNGEILMFFGFYVAFYKLVTGTAYDADASLPAATALAQSDADFLAINETGLLQFKLGSDHTFQEIAIRHLPNGPVQRMIGSTGSLSQNYYPWPEGTLMEVRENITLNSIFTTNTQGTAFPSTTPLMMEVIMVGMRLMNINDLGKEQLEAILRDINQNQVLLPAGG